MYEGSMVGAGATVFAVMGYVISKQQPPDFTVELNAKLLSAIIGEEEENITKAIEYLCAPDPGSRTDKCEGKRLIKVGAFTYHVVNGEAYHAMRNYEERKAYNREAQKKFREKKKSEGVDVPEIKSSKNGGSSKFSKPTADDLMKEGLPATEAYKFLNYHEARGWKMNGGRSPMKNWKAAVRTWKSSEFYKGESPGQEMTDEEILRHATS